MTTSKSPSDAVKQSAMTIKRRKRARFVFPLLWLILVLPAGASPSGILDSLRNWMFDFYQRAAPAQPSPKNSVLTIAIDFHVA